MTILEAQLLGIAGMGLAAAFAYCCFAIACKKSWFLRGALYAIAVLVLLLAVSYALLMQGGFPQ